MNRFAECNNVQHQRVEEINANCWQIIVELGEVGQFATLDKVLSVLFQRYGVFDFHQLQCGEMMSVPTLFFLAEINRKVAHFFYAISYLIQPLTL